MADRRTEQGTSQEPLRDTRVAPKKSLGQHFLRDGSVCARIVDLLDLSPDDNVLEVGPGPGALTKVLEAAPHARLLAIEKDDHWAKVRAMEGEARTTVLLMDALKYPWEEIEGAWKLCGNLPYNVASPLLWDMAARCPACVRAVFMVQKEVALRLAAEPGNRDYGALGVWVQAFWTARYRFTVKPGAFTPPPKVDSGVVSFEARPANERPPRPDLLAKVLKLCFAQRRKQLGGLLRRAGRTDLMERLEAMNVPLTARPEELSVAQFLVLSGNAELN